MAVSQDIVATYRGPGKVVQRLLSLGQREDRAFLFLLMACVLIFVAQAPFQSRSAFMDPTVPLNARLYWSALFFIFLLPFGLYLLAGASHLIAKVVGGKGSFYGARIALFWGLLASTPLILLNGMVAAFIGPGPEQTAVAVIWFVIFIWFWLRGLIVSETRNIQ